VSSAWIAGLRSVALEVPDLIRAEEFYTNVWQLGVARRTPEGLYLSGTGADHHVLSLHAGGPLAQVRYVSLRARDEALLDVIATAACAEGARVESSIAPLLDPAGGVGFTLRDPEGRRLQIVSGDQRRPEQAYRPDYPVRLAHVVLNSQNVAAATRFFERGLGFERIDRTRIMAFMNCNTDHHSIALADSDNTALNHIAFSMPDIDSVMRGGGRMRDAGHAIEWGPGRHGPGNNAFNYFIDPFDIVIEYTAEVEQVDASYRPGGPDDWKWPAGRVDQWGISPPPSDRLKRAQRAISFSSADG